jgi:ribosome-binding ATPase
MEFYDFIAAGSEAEARTRGHLATRGRDHIVEDGDIMHFLHNG